MRIAAGLLTIVTVALVAQAGLAQPEKDPKTTQEKPAAPSASTSTRVGDPYPLGTCAWAGKKLGTMGDPVVKVFEGREVRFCCDGCTPKFEKDLAASFAKVDPKIIEDQRPLYPLKTSLVTGKDLPEKPYELVYGNRLIRLGAEGEKAGVLKDAKKHLAELDKAAIAAQGKDYPVKTCIVSKEALGGDMGEPVDKVVGGRLIRLCCNECKGDLEKDPAKFIALIDEARTGAQPGAKDAPPKTSK